MFEPRAGYGSLLAVWAVLACAQRPTAPEPRSPRPQPSSAPAEPRSNGCDTTKSALQVTLKRGRPSATPTGIEATFVGAGHDDFADGRFDDWVEVRFQRGGEVTSRIVSLYGQRRAEELLGACWSLDSGGSEQIVITLYPRPG